MNRKGWGYFAKCIEKKEIIKLMKLWNVEYFINLRIEEKKVMMKDIYYSDNIDNDVDPANYPTMDPTKDPTWNQTRDLTFHPARDPTRYTCVIIIYRFDDIYWFFCVFVVDIIITQNNTISNNTISNIQKQSSR